MRCQVHLLISQVWYFVMIENGQMTNQVVGSKKVEEFALMLEMA